MTRSELERLKTQIIALKTAKEASEAILNNIKKNALYKLLPSWIRKIIEQ